AKGNRSLIKGDCSWYRCSPARCSLWLVNSRAGLNWLDLGGPRDWQWQDNTSYSLPPTSFSTTTCISTAARTKLNKLNWCLRESRNYNGACFCDRDGSLEVCSCFTRNSNGRRFRCSRGDINGAGRANGSGCFSSAGSVDYGRDFDRGC